MSAPPIIASPRLELWSLGASFLEASLAGEREAAAAMLEATIPDDWWQARKLAEMRLQDLRGDMELRPWLLRAMLRRTDRTMIGHVGFHWRPGSPHLAEYAAGGVELGYEVFPAFRRQGYATEAVAAMLDWATAQGVPSFALSIAPGNTPSLAIARRFGFEEVGTRIDELDGPELVLVRPAPPRPS